MITEQCPEAVFILCMQCVIGPIIESFIIGAIFAKMTLSKQRSQTLLFSRNAVICMREGKLSLMFRVGDLRKSHIIGASIRAILLHRKYTKEGEVLKQFQSELKVTADDCDDLLFIWPTIIQHTIDKESPLYYLQPSDLIRSKFEIVVILDGTIESTSMSTQARSSYLSNEIRWGYQFEELVQYHKELGDFRVDYSKFDEMIEVDAPYFSAAKLDDGEHNNLSLI